MIKWILLILFASQNIWAGNSLKEISLRCGPLAAGEKPLYSSDFKWDYDIPGMLLKFTEIYHSPKRLPQRAFWDAKKGVLKLPYDAGRGGDIQISETFVQSIVRHVERAFELSYVDGVFFPDMGHSHFLIPEQIMKEKYDRYPIANMTGMFQEMFKDERIKVLYHTAEQLKTLDEDGNVRNDEKIKWRFKTRNIVGELKTTTDLVVLQNPASKANTVNEVPGYFWWGGGFNLSAQKNGCFEYKAHGQTLYFDLSMYDLTSDPETGPWGGAY